MEDKFYITTAIDYVNDKPHIGHALEKIQADVLARWRRSQGKKVFFLTGSDEHGGKIFKTSKQKGMPVEEFAEENSLHFRALKDLLNLSWDKFIRTSDQKEHWPGVIKLWNIIFQKGDIYKKKYHGLYCVGHESFITEKDLQDGLCPDHKTAPENVEEENYFFKLSRYGKEIAELIQSDEITINPTSRKNEILGFLGHGLEDVSFSRPKSQVPWGIPVPDDDTQTIYVWADALTNYITGIGYGRDEENFKKWWPADVHLIGKDVLRFHAAIWPAMLLSAGLKPPREIFAHGFVTANGEKISKTIGNVINPSVVVKKYGTDAFRYYMLREVSPFADGDFSDEKILQRYNGDLADGLGNLVARVAALGEKEGELRENQDKEISVKIKFTKKEIETHLENRRFDLAIAQIWNLISGVNKYINENRPWEVTSTDKKQLIYNSGLALGEIAGLLIPFLPETSEKIKEQIIFNEKSETVSFQKKGALFPRI